MRLDDWIAGHAVELKPSTAASYRSKIELYLKPAIGHERLQAPLPAACQPCSVTCTSGGKDGRPALPARWSLLALFCGER